jgi:hypothetical protein
MSAIRACIDAPSPARIALGRAGAFAELVDEAQAGTDPSLAAALYLTELTGQSVVLGAHQHAAQAVLIDRAGPRAGDEVVTEAPSSPRVLRAVVSHEQADRMLDALVRSMCEAGTSWNRARDLVRRGKVRVDGQITTDITCRVAKGSEIVLDVHARNLREHELSPDRVLYVDADVVVVSKPAGLMTVPYDDEKNTLVGPPHNFPRASRDRP